MRKKINYCKKCNIILDKNNSYYPKHTNMLCKKHYLDYMKLYFHKYRKTKKGKDAVKEATRRSRINNKAKWTTRVKTQNAISKGIIIKPNKCEICYKKCSGHALQAHHKDYSKPFEVIFLCYKCHAIADKKLENKLK